MKTIAELLAEHRFFKGLDRHSLELIAGCGRNVHFEVGERILTAGERADAFYVLRSGKAALGFYVPERGTVVVDTVGGGELLGWSWLFEPYRWQFDADAVEAVSAVEFDGKCLLEKCDTDPRLGYLLTQGFARVMLGRLQSVRLRLLDVYGTGNSAR